MNSIENNIINSKNEETKILSIDIEKYVIENYKDALRISNSIKKHIVKICENNQYNCVGIIGIRHLDNDLENKRANEPIRQKYKTFVPGPSILAPIQLHIMLVVNPVSEFKKLICNYLRKKTKEEVTCKEILDDNYREELLDLLYMSRKHRTIDCFSNDLNPLAFDFISYATMKYRPPFKEEPLFDCYISNMITGELYIIKDNEIVYRAFPKRENGINIWEPFIYVPKPKIIYEKVDLWSDVLTPEGV